MLQCGMDNLKWSLKRINIKLFSKNSSYCETREPARTL